MYISHERFSREGFKSRKTLRIQEGLERTASRARRERSRVKLRIKAENSNEAEGAMKIRRDFKVLLVGNGFPQVKRHEGRGRFHAVQFHETFYEN